MNRYDIGTNFEKILVKLLNQEEIQKGTMWEDAKLLLSHIPLKGKAFWCGSKTSKELGDIILNGKRIEVKYTASSLGTYHNTSVELLNKLYGINWKEYYCNFFDFLKEEDLPFNYKNASPFDYNTARDIRKNKNSLYKIIAKKEKSIRDNFVKSIFPIIEKNKDNFLNSLLKKTKSDLTEKGIPDLLIAFNYLDKKIFQIKKEEIEKIVTKDIYLKDSSIVFICENFKVRTSFAWQNGTGLNNFTIRVFLECL